MPVLPLRHPESQGIWAAYHVGQPGGRALQEWQETFCPLPTAEILASEAGAGQETGHPSGSWTRAGPLLQCAVGIAWG